MGDGSRISPWGCWVAVPFGSWSFSGLIASLPLGGSRGSARRERAGAAGLRAQEWNGEARRSGGGGDFALKSGTARQEGAAAAASSCGVEGRGKSSSSGLNLGALGESVGGCLRISTWGCWVAAPCRRRSFSGLSVSWCIGRSRGTTRQVETAASRSRPERRGESQLDPEEGPREALWANGLCGVAWAPSGCGGRLCAGRPPCVQGRVFAMLGLLPLCSFGCPERGATL